MSNNVLAIFLGILQFVSIDQPVVPPWSWCGGRSLLSSASVGGCTRPEYWRHHPVTCPCRGFSLVVPSLGAVPDSWRHGHICLWSGHCCTRRRCQPVWRHTQYPPYLVRSTVVFLSEEDIMIFLDVMWFNAIHSKMNKVYVKYNVSSNTVTIDSCDFHENSC